MDAYPLIQSPARARALSKYLRDGDDADLRDRRRIVALSLVGCGAMAAIGLYQIGLTRRAPGLGLPGSDPSKITRSAEAYTFARTPDALLGLVSYAMTAALAAAGGRNRSTLLPLALAAKATADATVAAKLTIDQPTKFGAFSEVSLVAAGSTIAALPFALRVARRALLGGN